MNAPKYNKMLMLFDNIKEFGKIQLFQASDTATFNPITESWRDFMQKYPDSAQSIMTSDTPRTHEIFTPVLEAFSQYTKGNICMEAVVAVFSRAECEIGDLERELNKALNGRQPKRRK